MIKYILYVEEDFPSLRNLQGGFTLIQRFEGKFAVGIKQTLKHLNNGEGGRVYIALNADKDLIEPVVKLAQEKSVEIVYVESKKELGRLCGIDVGAATAITL